MEPSDAQSELNRILSGFFEDLAEGANPRAAIRLTMGAGNASAAINKHIKDLRGDDVRLTFHSFRHTLQSKALAATDMPNKFPAYIGGWQNGDAKGLQAEYQKGGIPLKVLKEALQTIHAVEDWGRFLNDPHHDEWN